MAGVTGDGAIPAEICIVDPEHHFHHASGALFRGLLVAFEMVLIVAIIAAHAECECDVTHRGHELVGGNIR